MPLPLLNVKPTALNARVRNFMPGTDESPHQAPAAAVQDPAALDAQIEQAYRQIFFHAFRSDRDPVLESQLRSGQIRVRDFIRGLLLSEKFRQDFYRCNSNYRIVEQLVGRVLGRPVYGEQERIAWSILIAEQGLPAFVDALLTSPEYLTHFGEDRVPYQRSRTLAGQSVGARPFNQQAPRYDAYWRDSSSRRAPAGANPWVPGVPRPAWLADQPAPWARQLWLGIILGGGAILSVFGVLTVAAMLST
ncbi:MULTISPECIES: phycobilisome rod-core linker polypeptide [Aphanothece]|uniref:phycobilisome rod-core linker polypeptide n=1 Tax=Aphanothece TaxID=1121 RepID=UPI00398EB0C6